MIPSIYHYDLRKIYSLLRILSRGFSQLKLKFYRSRIFNKKITKQLLTYQKFKQTKKEIEIISSLNYPYIIIYYYTIESFG